MWTSVPRPLNSCGKFTALSCLICLFFTTNIRAQDKCASCSVPAFAALTVYHTMQTGPGMGFGLEAGKWKKDAGKFSYFLGTEVLWTNNEQNEGKTTTRSKTVVISFYVKGQFKLANRFYLIGQPELVNLSYLELRTGFRYVMPITNTLGVGLEPGYAFVKKQCSLNSSIHLALP
jgi:hypothetical protein